VFPGSPDERQLSRPQPGAGVDLEAHFAVRNDVESVVLERGREFDEVVLAVSIGMLPIVASELIDDQPSWRDMVDNVGTVATQAFQIWLRPDEPALGWARPGATVSGYVSPFETWASMPQTLWAEDWPDDRRPGTVAYFCNAYDAPLPLPDGPEDGEHQRRHDRCVRENAVRFLDGPVGVHLPGAIDGSGRFRWSLLCGADGRSGEQAFATQHWRANVDPSDRYVQSLPGSDRFRLRPDESGYDNLVLAGDWTDSGLNAGCIEAAVLSGFQAANALNGRARHHRVRGYYLT
jgi:uncharacterized protein with NAD-binding domain and iron-sulfur cluster